MDRDARGACPESARPRHEDRHIRHNRVATTRRLTRLGATVFAAAVVAAVVASSAFAALFFLFKPTAAKPGEVVTVRTGGTPASFTLAQRRRPFQRPIRLYLVPNDIADEVHTRFDGRAHFIGQLVPDRNGRGVLAFAVPPLDTDEYVAAAWCPACARYSGGRTFSVLAVGSDTAPRYRPLMLLRVQMPDAGEACPVTIPRGGKPPPGLAAHRTWHGNGFLWTGLQADGVFWVPPDNVGWPGDPPGSIASKFFWFAARVDGTLALSGRRLDAPSAPSLVVHRVNRGRASGFRGSGTWATPVSFPSEGCWRLTARVADISLSYVVKVVRTP